MHWNYSQSKNDGNMILFCNAANLKTFNEERTIGKKNDDLPSAKNYRTGLIEELHARTKLHDNAVQERWQALLDEPKFQERTLTKTVDSQETTVAELMAELAGQPIDKYACIAIKGNSGEAKQRSSPKWPSLCWSRTNSTCSH